MTTTYDRPTEATLHVHLANGETWEATGADLAKFGLERPSDIYRRFATNLKAALLSHKIIGRDQDLTECELEPVRELVDTAITNLDRPDYETWAEVADLEARLRRLKAIESNAPRPSEAQMVSALELIDKHGCENSSKTRCHDDPGRSRDAIYGAESWCDACIARDALNNESETA